MATCHYCGQSAGFLRKEHKSCRLAFETASTNMLEQAIETAETGVGLDTLHERLTSIAGDGPHPDIHWTIREGWKEALDIALEDEGVSADEDRSLTAYANHFQLSQENMNDNGEWMKFVQARIIRRLSEGYYPDVQLDIEGRLPFNLQKSERLIWAFSDVEYHTEVVRREFKAGSSGYSMRVMKGVYVRQSAIRGRSVASKEMAQVDAGILGVTQKHIYFAGSNKAFRIPYSKIVAFQPFEDGFGIQRDGARAKPEAFKTGDGWFVLNLVENIAQQDEFVDVPESVETLESPRTDAASVTERATATSEMIDVEQFDTDHRDPSV